MGLVIARYEELQLAEDANTAQAVIAMTLAEGPKVKARLRFNFEKTPRGWRVVSHEQLK